MVRAWYVNEAALANGADQRDPLRHEDDHELAKDVSMTTLRALGVLYWNVEPGPEEQGYSSERLQQIREARGYANHDIIEVSPDRLPGYEEKIKKFFEEHLHTDEEIRYILGGSGYFDVRDPEERWIRIELHANDMIVLPAGVYHRFTLDRNNYIKAMRLFKDEPKWTAYNRGGETDEFEVRKAYLEEREQRLNVAQPSGPNGTPYVLRYAAKSIANYPHMRKAGGMLYVSGLSSRRPDNTHVGAVQDENGEWHLDAAAQTHACIENLQNILATAGADLSHVVDLTCFLVDMDDYKQFNAAYNQYFDAATGPTRTTVAVKQLPHPNLRIEIKAVAVVPEE